MTKPCTRCGQMNPLTAGTAFCARCGAALARDVGFDEMVLPGGQVLRSVGVAYGLWALCLVGVAGLHRFYAGKYITGVIWLLTWGLLGIGTVIDLFLISGMVERANRRLAARF